MADDLTRLTGWMRRSIYALLTGALMLPGFFIGLLWHRSCDGFKVARRWLDQRDDECIDKGWLFNKGETHG